VAILSAALVAAFSVWAGFRAAGLPSSPRSPSSADALAAVPREPIVFSYLNWDSAQFQTRVVMHIVEEGYGYPVDTVVGDATSIFRALIDGRPQVSMEVWLPSEEFEKAVASGKLLSLGKSLDDNWQSGFVIPSYVAQQHPGLKSVYDLPEFKQVFADPDGDSGKARLMSCVTGWVCGAINQQKVSAYELEDSVQLLRPDSGRELFSSLEEAYARREPWLGYMWSPTRTAVELDLTALEEPPYSVQCWETDKACAYPTAQIVIGVHPSLPGLAPDVIEFLKNWDFDAASQVAAETWMQENGGTIDEAALWFLRTNEDWPQWAPEEVVSRVRASLGGRVAGALP
jgi:glycine betaine/proline transport system substrate-binding protein